MSLAVPISTILYIITSYILNLFICKTVITTTPTGRGNGGGGGGGGGGGMTIRVSDKEFSFNSFPIHLNSKALSFLCLVRPYLSLS